MQKVKIVKARAGERQQGQIKDLRAVETHDPDVLASEARIASVALLFGLDVACAIRDAAKETHVGGEVVMALARDVTFQGDVYRAARDVARRALVGREGKTILTIETARRAFEPA